MGYKAYSDSYLMSLTKEQIIELLRVAEHNFFCNGGNSEQFSEGRYGDS